MPDLINSLSIQPIHKVVKNINGSPLFIIGLGDCGYEVLSSYKKSILDRIGNGFPKDIRLLWIVYRNEMGERSKRSLSDPEILIIDNPAADQGGLTETRKAFIETIYHKHCPTWDMVLNDMKSKLIHPPDNNFPTYIVGSLSDPIIRILPDLTFLLRNQGVRIRHIVPWLVYETILDQNREAKAKQIAMIRELSRFMTGRRQVFDRGDDEDYLISKEFLFDGIMLFDSPRARDAIANQLVILTDSSASAKFNSEIPKMGQTSSSCLSVSSCSELICNFPVSQLSDLLRLRLVSHTLDKLLLNDPVPTDEVVQSIDQLFSSTKDMLGSYLLAIKKISLGDFSKDSIESGVKGQSSLSDCLIIWFKEQYSQKFVNSGLVHKFGYLKWMDSIIEALGRRLEKASSNCLKIYGNSATNTEPAIIKELKNRIEADRYVLKKMRDEILPWIKTWSNNYSQEPPTKFGHVRQKTDILCNLRTKIENEYQYLKMNLEKMVAGSDGYIGFIASSIQSDIEAIINGYFSQYLPLQSGKVDSQNILTHLLFSWEMLSRGNGLTPQLHLIVVDPETSGAVGQLFPRHVSETEQIFTEIIKLTRYTMQQFPDERTTFNSIMGPERIDDVIKKHNILKPLLGVKASPEKDPNFSELWLCGDPLLFTRIINHSNVIKAKNHTAIENYDPYEFAVLKIHHGISINNIPVIQKDLSYHSPDPENHVFREEQFANGYEKLLNFKPGEWFNPTFIRLMHNKDAFETIMWCVFHNWIKECIFGNDYGWYIISPEWKNLKPIAIKCNDIEPTQFEDALGHLLVDIPTTAIGTNHPFEKRELTNTIQKLKLELAELTNKSFSWKSKYSKSRLIYFEKKDTTDPFSIGLYKFQKYLAKIFPLQR